MIGEQLGEISPQELLVFIQASHAIRCHRGLENTLRQHTLRRSAEADQTFNFGWFELIRKLKIGGFEVDFPAGADRLVL